MSIPLPPTELFSEIAPRYDLLNKLLSVGLDKGWRIQLARLAHKFAPPGGVLDLACGTGDMLSAIVSADSSRTPIGVDPCFEMLKIAKRKLSKKNHLVVSTGEYLPFQPQKFGIVSVAFGLRNFADLGLGLAEIHRVLVPRGVLAILEFHPHSSPMRSLVNIVLNQAAPVFAGMIGGPQWAYKYLVESMEGFEPPSIWLERLDKAGFLLRARRSRIFGMGCFWIFSRRENA